MQSELPSELERPLRILHLEDSPEDAELIRDALESGQVSCEIQRVATREDFQAALRRETFDLILADYTLPTFDGLSALKLAREECADTSFIFVSGTLGEDKAVESLQGGALDYVLKHRLQRLVAAVRRATRERHERQERRRVENELRQSHELFRQISDNVDDLIAVLDLQGRRLFNSPSYEKLLGSAKALTGTDSFADIHPADRERIRAIFEDTVATGKGHRTEYRLLMRDGRVADIESQGSVIQDQEGKVAKVVVISRDVTERKQLQEQRLRTQRLENIGALAGGIAHDLNNMLAPVLMAVDFLHGELTDPAIRQLLETVKLSVRRGSDLVKQILQFAGGVKGEPIALQLKPIIQDLVKMAKATFPRSIRIEATVTSDLPLVLGDATQLHQVLLNLCVNARDAMPQGGSLAIRASSVALEAKTPPGQMEPVSGRYVLVTVADTGCGIAPHLLDKVFQPFFTTKDGGQGTGLGLSTVWNIIRTHNGFIEVSSQPGQGTTFSVYLPATAQALPAPAVDAAPALPVGHGERILVVDDELALLEMTKEVLEAYRYRVTTARDGAEALAIYQQRRERIDLVITDVMMPVMDGPALIQALRNLDPNLKIICVSGLASETRLKGVNRSAVQAFLRKPYMVDQLLATVRTILPAAAGENCGAVPIETS